MRFTFSGACFQKAVLDHEILKCGGQRGLQKSPIPHFQGRKTEELKGKWCAQLTQHINDRYRIRDSSPDSWWENFNPRSNLVFLEYTKLIASDPARTDQLIFCSLVSWHIQNLFMICLSIIKKKLKWLT